MGEEGLIYEKLKAADCNLDCHINFHIKDAHILQDVKAQFQAGKCTALMGPSGAGKTSLLNVLCGRAKYGEVTGEVLANGTRIEPAFFKQQLTYVPQNDVLWSALTVRQLLMYTAQLRLAISDEERAARVEEVMSQLNLLERADVMVGDDLNPSLSGGQRKRVSIAMELLADRPVLFVDEPTSGLDSVTAAEVVELLCELAERSRKTIICTIHQPTWDMLQRFHALLVLAKGQVVYDGQVTGLVEYIHQMDSAGECPAYVNPIDHFFELISKPDAASIWHRYFLQSHENCLTPCGPLHPTADFSTDYPVGRMAQTTILFCRGVFLLKDFSRGPALILPQVFLSIVLGFSFYQEGYGTSTNPDTTIANLVFMMIALNFMVNLMMSVVSIPLEKAIVLREYRNGTYSLVSYWVGRLCLSMISVVLISLITTPIVYFLVGMPSEFLRFGAFYLMLVTLGCFAQTLSLVVGCSISNAEAAVQKIPPVMVLLMLYAGLLIPKTKMHPWFVWVYYVNPFNYAYKVLMYVVCKGEGAGAGDALLEFFSVTQHDQIVSVAVVAGLLVLLWIVGYFFAKRSF